MNATPDMKSVPTDAEAACLSKGKRDRPYHPKGEREQLLVCRLIERGWMQFGTLHRDNRAVTTFAGAYALATWAGRKYPMNRCGGKKRTNGDAPEVLIVGKGAGK